MTISETADRIWAALCEMKESEGVVLKDHFTRRVTEILAAEEATVEIKPTPDWEPPRNGSKTIKRGGRIYEWNAIIQAWVAAP